MQIDQMKITYIPTLLHFHTPPAPYSSLPTIQYPSASNLGYFRCSTGQDKYHQLWLASGCNRNVSFPTPVPTFRPYPLLTPSLPPPYPP